MCILNFPTTIICNFISGINQRDIVKAPKFLCNVPDIFSGFEQALIFLVIFEEKSPIKNFPKKSIKRELSYAMRVDRQLDRCDKAISHFSKLCECTKTEYLSHIKHTVSPFQVLQFNVVQDNNHCLC
jgi:hypothetical protein